MEASGDRRFAVINSSATKTDNATFRTTQPMAVLKQVLPLPAGSSLVRWVLDREVLIGRQVDPDRGICLSDDEKVSKKHVQLQPRGLTVDLEDLGSKNHTYVDGREVKQATLHDGSVVRVGNTLLVLRFELPGVSDAPLSEYQLHRKLLGQSQEMRALRTSLSRAACVLDPVLLLGPTGVGKELAAAAIHALSLRSERPFVAVNCGAIPASLVESPLFGHKRGAFTGAERDHDGYFKQADTGTLFLDEVGDSSLDLQVKLLRVLQPAEPGTFSAQGKNHLRIRPVGHSADVVVDVRVISATNIDLEESVAAGRLREDFLQRIGVLTVRFPALIEHREDILPLFAHYLNLDRPTARPRVISARLGELLLLQKWKGNVRELESLSKQLRALTPSADRIDLDVLPQSLLDRLEQSLMLPDGITPELQRSGKPKQRITKDVLVRLLEENDGKILRVARWLGLSPKEIRRKMDNLGIARPHAKRSDAKATVDPQQLDGTPTDDDGDDSE
jgi:DNA-binding NtrC family response regulator